MVIGFYVRNGQILQLLEHLMGCEIDPDTLTAPSFDLRQAIATSNTYVTYIHWASYSQSTWIQRQSFPLTYLLS